MTRPFRPARLAVVALLGGCISVDVGGRSGEPVPEDRLHVLAPPAAAAGAPSPGSAARPAVAVRPFRAAGRIEKRVHRRAAPDRVVPLPFDYWADEPSRAVTDAVREELAASGRFAAVVDPASAFEADLVLEGEIQEYAWVEGTPSRAVLRIRVTWADARAGHVLASSVEEAAEDLPGPGTDGLGTAMGRAVARVARRAAESPGGPPAR